MTPILRLRDSGGSFFLVAKKTAQESSSDQRVTRRCIGLSPGKIGKFTEGLGCKYGKIIDPNPNRIVIPAGVIPNPDRS